MKSPINIAGALVTVALIVASLFAPLLAPYNPVEQHTSRRLHGPSAQHVLGTDSFGRDTLSRIIVGSRASILVGVTAVACSLVVGTSIGIFSAYRGGLIDEGLMRVVDALMAFPALLMGLMIVAALGSGISSVIIAVTVSLLPGFVRIARASALPLRNREFTQAAQAIGAPDLRILFRHVLPNMVSPIVVMASLQIAAAIRMEASLSFLGMGIQPPTPTWGNMIRDGMPYIQISAWPSTMSGLAIMLVVMAFNIVGDGLRDALDPRLLKEK